MEQKLSKVEELKLENKCLSKRLKHLFQSNLICLYDEVNPKTKSYKLNINDLDKKYEKLINCYNLVFGEGTINLKNDKGVEMRIKEIKCNVCDSKIELKKELVYEVAEYNGILGQKIYNAIDCQKCGCQKLLYPRIKKINLDNKVGDNK